MRTHIDNSVDKSSLKCLSSLQIFINNNNKLFKRSLDHEFQLIPLFITHPSFAIVLSGAMSNADSSNSTGIVI